MKIKDKNRPRSPLSGYACFVQVIREKHRSLNPNENVIFSEFAKKCAEKWRVIFFAKRRRILRAGFYSLALPFVMQELPVDRRAPFEEMSRLDIKRYNREMSEYVQQQQPQQQMLHHGQQGQPSGGQTPQPMTHHISTQQHVRGVKRRRLKDPGMPKRSLSAFFFFCDEYRPKIRASHPEWKVSDIAKDLGKRWEECTNKAPYEVQAQNDKLRYEEVCLLFKPYKPIENFFKLSIRHALLLKRFTGAQSDLQQAVSCMFYSSSGSHIGSKQRLVSVSMERRYYPRCTRRSRGRPSILVVITALKTSATLLGFMSNP